MPPIYGHPPSIELPSKYISIFSPRIMGIFVIVTLLRMLCFYLMTGATGMWKAGGLVLHVRYIYRVL